MSGVEIRAYFPGVCAADCGQPIQVGQLIGLDTPHGTAPGTAWRHVVCPDTPDEVADRAALALPRCTICGANHPGEC